MAMRLFELFPVWKLSFFGSILTAVLLLVLLLRHGRFLLRPGYSALVALALMASAWIFRWIIFMAVQGVPKYGAGLYLYQMPLGSAGLLGIVGMFGLCVSLMAVISFLLDRYPEHGLRGQMA